MLDKLRSRHWNPINFSSWGPAERKWIATDRSGSKQQSRSSMNRSPVIFSTSTIHVKIEEPRVWVFIEQSVTRKTNSASNSLIYKYVYRVFREEWKAVLRSSESVSSVLLVHVLSKEVQRKNQKENRSKMTITVFLTNEECPKLMRSANHKPQSLVGNAGA